MMHSVNSKHFSKITISSPDSDIGAILMKSLLCRIFSTNMHILKFKPAFLLFFYRTRKKWFHFSSRRRASFNTSSGLQSVSNQQRKHHNNFHLKAAFNFTLLTYQSNYEFIGERINFFEQFHVFIPHFSIRLSE